MYTLVKDIYKKHEDFLDKEIYIGGWIRTIRDNKSFGFIELNDGTFLKNIQIVIDETLENYEEVKKLYIGSCISIKGILVKSLGNKQLFELKALNIEVEGKSQEDYPLQKKRHSLEFLRTIAHLRPRTNLGMSVFRVRSLASFAIHKFFNEKGYVYLHSPIITGSDAEGAGEMFKVTTLDLGKKENYKEDFFGKMASLSVSGQLQAETFALAFRNVYTFGPTFRAENSNTPRHLAEFWMMEPEIAFADLKENMNIAEEMIKYVIEYVMKNAKEEMELFNSFVDTTLLERLNNVLNNDFERITYTNAIEILEKSNEKFEYAVSWGMDLQTEHERYICEKVYQKPVYITDYPKDIKAFYMKLNQDNKTVAAMDLLVPGIGELIGGSQREERYDVLLERMEQCNLNTEDYWWYLDLRKYGTVKHSGFGLGFERFIRYITGVENIRDVTPFPRSVNNLEF